MDCLTVGEVVALLLKCDQSKPLIHEGCDCFGNAVGVFEDAEEVTITRSEQETWSTTEGQWIGPILESKVAA